MFGLWFSISGLLFGMLCSYEAKRKGRSYQDWFTLGFIFSVAALITLILLPSEGSTKPVGQIKLDIDKRLSLSRPIL